MKAGPPARNRDDRRDTGVGVYYNRWISRESTTTGHGRGALFRRQAAGGAQQEFGKSISTEEIAVQYPKSNGWTMVSPVGARLLGKGITQVGEDDRVIRRRFPTSPLSDEGVSISA